MQENANNSKIISSLFLSVMLDYMSFSIALPLIPFYAKYFNASPFEVSILIGIFPAVMIFSAPFWGHLSDRVGYRIALLLSIVGTGISYLWFGFATSLWMLFVSRIVAGLTGSSIAISRSYVARYVDPAHRTKQFALLEAALGVGFILGPLVTSILVGSDADNPQLRLPSYVAAVTSCLAFIYVFWVLPKGSPIPKATSKLDSSMWEVPKYLFKILKYPMMLDLIGVITANFLVLFGIMAIYALWTEAQLGWGAREFSNACIGAAVVSTIFLIAFTKTASYFKEGNLVMWSFVMMGSGLLLLPFTPNLTYLVIANCLLIGGAIAANPTLYTLISKVVDANEQGKILGFVTSISNLASLIGAAIAGFLFQTFGRHTHFIVGGSLFFLIAIFCRYRINNSRLLKIKYQRRRQKLNNLFDLFDLDKNGILQLSDFENAVTKISKLRGWKLDSQNFIMLFSFWIDFGKKLQAEADLHYLGQIKREQWLEYLDGYLDYNFSDALIKIMDLDQDSKIAIDEFKILYKNYNKERVG